MRRFLLIALLAAWCGGASAAEIWFAPGDDLEVHGVIAHPDYPELFAPDPPWPVGLSRITGIEMRAPWFLRMPPDVVRRATGFLAAHHLAIATAFGGVAADECGSGVEGIMTPRQMAVYPREMRKMGIVPQDMLLDEPLYYGHDYDGPNACRFPIDEVARRVAWSVRMVRSTYPSIRVVLIEPVTSLAGGPAELAAFLDAFRRETGGYPLSVRFDLAWHLPWRDEVPGFIDVLRRRGIGYGIILDATRGGAQPSDGAWVMSAEENTQAFDRIMAERPNQVILQSWVPHPVKLVPESDPTTMTGFLRWYVTRQAR